MTNLDAVGGRDNPPVRDQSCAALVLELTTLVLKEKIFELSPKIFCVRWPPV